MKRKIIIPFFLCLLGFSLTRCAQVVTPTGGPKDETPPKVLRSTPKNFTANFNGKEIEIIFNEYIKLNNIDQKLLVSPPLKHKLVTKLKGKSLLIELKDTLLENTTYTLNFADAIVDNNEDNPLKNFEFAFSTGAELDSLRVRGLILDAYTLQPKEGVVAMLYEDMGDSVPYMDLPSHLLKTDKEGIFELNNIKNGIFKIFALEDVNSNYLFDQPDEWIAFSDSLVNFREQWVEKTDSLSPDSLVTDSVKILKANDFTLYLFQEDYKGQYLVNNERPLDRKLTFSFNRPLYEDSLKIFPLNFTPGSLWYIVEKSINIDTVTCWITDTSVRNMEEISVLLSFLARDSIKQLSWISDTLNLKYTFKKEELKKEKKEKEEKYDKGGPEKKKSKKTKKEEEEKEAADTLKQPEKEYLQLSLNVKKSSIFDLGKAITITSPSPVFNYSPEKISIFFVKDSIDHPQKITVRKDSIGISKFIIDYAWEENTSCKLLIEPNTFTDIYGLSNDTILIPFQTLKVEQYGTIILNINGANPNILVQLLESKDEKLVRQQRVGNNQIINFTYLVPKEYKLKVVYDSNNNLKWDTGSYLKKIQPEKVAYYKDLVNVRANWDVELTWKLEGD